MKLAWPQQSVAEVSERLGSSIKEGLPKSQITDRLNQYGSNVLPQKAQKHIFLRFLTHFNDVLIYILLIAAIATAAMGHWVDTIVILGVAVINALIGFIQENSAEKSLKSIRGMLSNTATVIRDGITQDIDASDLVPGDVVFLKPGTKVPADLRLFEVHSLMVEEAILTGESTVVEKQTDKIDGETMLGDQHNMAFSGTTVSAGTGYGMVVATGEHSQLGHINQMMTEIDSNRTPLLEQMDKLGKSIFIFILAMMVILFIFGFFFRGIPLGELSLLLISLAVASVPEGLPAIISIILSLGVQTMARKKAIIRKLPTVETLGAMTVVCSDKTGTLTLNEMVAQTVILADNTYQITGNGYNPTGSIVDIATNQPAILEQDQVLNQFLTAIKLCNDSQVTCDDNGQWVVTGGPTEAALKVLAIKSGLEIESRSERINKIPFDSSYKYMSTQNKVGDKHFIFVTGAPDVLFKLCQFQLTAEGKQVFDQSYWESKIEEFAQKGLRMLAAVYKDDTNNLTKLGHQDIADGMVFLGLAGIMDPPRPEAIEAIKLCQSAGIRVKMITGDHQQTAMAIGAMLNIGNGKEAITGAEIEKLSDAQLAKVACQYDIFARTSPEHKLRLVRALQFNGEVVGMTGDGVNDAPALKQAEVGIAMGIKGTEVTKEAADMVLVDDNFATIANAVREGRRVYDNLKKTILFVLPTNLAQGLLIIIAILLGLAAPLTPLQILWMNMATSTTLSFGLASELAESDIMNRPPRNPNKSILDLYALWRIVFVGILIAGGAFILENYLMNKGYSDAFIRTVLLQALVTAQWVYLFNCRAQTEFALDRTVLKNRGLWIVSGLLLLLQLAIIYVPIMNRIFDTKPLPISYWFISLIVGASIFLLVEIEKYIIRYFKTTQRFKT